MAPFIVDEEDFILYVIITTAAFSAILVPFQCVVLYRTLKCKMWLLSLLGFLLMVPNYAFLSKVSIAYMAEKRDTLAPWKNQLLGFLTFLSFISISICHWVLTYRYYMLGLKMGF